MAQVFFLKLNKRNYKTRIRLTPLGGDIMKVHFRIDGDNHYFYPSAAMGDQFSSFLTALYCLYNEENNCHTYPPRMKYWKHPLFQHQFPCQRNDGLYSISIPIRWDEEGSIIDISFTRLSATDKTLPYTTPDPIRISFSYREGEYEYTVDGRELCYAVARGYTETLKKYGFQGYIFSSGGTNKGDSFELEEFLFVKAYALDAMEVREMKLSWENPRSWDNAYATAFDKEMELLLFDM